MILLLHLGGMQAQADRCGFSSITERLINHPASAKAAVEIEHQISEWLHAQSGKRTAVNYVIPIVVHVVWEQEVEDISYDQILSQIDALNRDFDQIGMEYSDLPEEFKSVVPRSSIQFCLAGLTPEGTYTNGVTRTQTELTNIGSRFNIHYDELGGKSIWDPDKYLNIWVCNVDDSREILGFARPPSAVGKDADEKDGVVIDYRAFGAKGTALSPTDGGRTLVHEIGHYLHLRHLWKENVCADDGVPDTPIQATGYRGCPDQPNSTCGSLDMPMNFMDYVDDHCMRLFTEGQMQRMIAVLNTARQSLVRNSASTCGFTTSAYQLKEPGQMQVYPNPVEDVLHLHLDDWFINAKHWQLMDFLGRPILEGTIRADQSNLKLDVSKLSSGIFQVKVQSTDRLAVRSIVKY